MKKTYFCYLLLALSVCIALTCFSDDTDAVTDKTFSDENFDYHTHEYDAEIIGYHGTNPKDLHIPGVVTYDKVNYTITSIGPNAFADNNVEGVISFDDNITKIGIGAFKNCSKITHVDLKDISNIGSKAFEGCNNIVWIKFDNYLNTIETDSFSITLYDFDSKTPISIDTSNTKGFTFSNHNGHVTKDPKTMKVLVRSHLYMPIDPFQDELLEEERWLSYMGPDGEPLSSPGGGYALCRYFPSDELYVHPPGYDDYYTETASPLNFYITSKVIPGDMMNPDEIEYHAYYYRFYSGTLKFEITSYEPGTESVKLIGSVCKISEIPKTVDYAERTFKVTAIDFDSIDQEFDTSVKLWNDIEFKISDSEYKIKSYKDKTIELTSMPILKGDLKSSVNVMSDTFIVDSIKANAIRTIESPRFYIPDTISTVELNSFENYTIENYNGTPLSDSTKIAGHYYLKSENKIVVEYKIKIQFNVNSEIYQTIDVQYGTTVTPPNNPPDYSDVQNVYSFSHWINFDSTHKFTENTTFNAAFNSTLRTYCIQFINEGQIFDSNIVEYGSKIILPANTPLKKSTTAYYYTFDCWKGYEKDMTVSGDMSFYANYLQELRAYTISFYNEHTLFYSFIEKYGSKVNAPLEVPTKDSDIYYDYIFKNWTGLTGDTIVSGNMSFYASYDKTTHYFTLNFISEGEIFESQQCSYGSYIYAPSSEPSKAPDAYYRYTFDHWSGLTYDTVRGDADFNAVFSKNAREFSIKFMVNGGLYMENNVLYGNPIVLPVDPVLSPTVKNQYEFIGWKDYREGMTVTGEQTFEARFYTELREYDVIFMDGENIIMKYRAAYGSKIMPPLDTPVRESTAEFDYSFAGWGGYTEDMTVTGNFTSKACFSEKIRSYNIIFTSDGNVISEKLIPYGTEICAPLENVIKPSDMMFEYVFTRWSGYYEGITVTGEQTFDAVFSKVYKQYVVTFLSEGTMVKQTTQVYGSPIDLPSDPVKESTAQYDHPFIGWKGYEPGMEVKGNCCFTADFDDVIREYHVVFKTQQNTVSNEILPYGTTIVLPEDPIIKDQSGVEYTFLGWNGYCNGMTVKGDVTFEALFQKADITYTVQFKSDSVLVDSRIYHYGDELIIPAAPHKESTAEFDYIFMGWKDLDDDLSVKEDRTYVAEYREQIRNYTTTFLSEGTEYSVIKVPYGSAPVLPKDPVKNPSGVYSYSFVCWNGYYDNLVVKSDMTFTAVYDMHMSALPSTPDTDDVIIQLNPGCQIDIDAELLIQINDRISANDTEFEIKMDEGSIGFDKIALNSIVWDDVSMSIEDKTGALIGQFFDTLKDKTVYNVELHGKDGNISQFQNNGEQGNISVTVKYELKDGENPEGLSVWYFDDGELKEERRCGYTEIDGQGFVTFDSEHLSDFAIGYNPAPEGPNMLYIGIGAAVAVTLCVLAFVLVRRK